MTSKRAAMMGWSMSWTMERSVRMGLLEGMTMVMASPRKGWTTGTSPERSRSAHQMGCWSMMVRMTTMGRRGARARAARRAVTAAAAAASLTVFVLVTMAFSTRARMTAGPRAIGSSARSSMVARIVSTARGRGAAAAAVRLVRVQVVLAELLLELGHLLHDLVALFTLVMGLSMMQFVKLQLHRRILEVLLFIVVYSARTHARLELSSREYTMPRAL